MSRLFAISDLHLSGSVEKPMDVFGAGWENHWEKIRQSWLDKIRDEDWVLIPGDISWAMHLEDAWVDLEEIFALPGKKVILRGNHDYWWSAVGQLRKGLKPGAYALQNDAVGGDGWMIAGSRGWSCPGNGALDPQDEKIYLREAQRLELSLKDAVKKRQPGDRLVAMMHFPPFNERREPSLFTDLIERYEVETVVYGHLHGPNLRNVFEGELGGVCYKMVSCDYVGFKVVEIK